MTEEEWQKGNCIYILFANNHTVHMKIRCITKHSGFRMKVEKKVKPLDRKNKKGRRTLTSTRFCVPYKETVLHGKAPSDFSVDVLSCCWKLWLNYQQRNKPITYSKTLYQAESAPIITCFTAKSTYAGSTSRTRHTSLTTCLTASSAYGSG